MEGTRSKDIITEFENLFSGGCFSVANNMLAKVYINVPTLPTHKLITYVKAAHPEKDKLKVYPYLFNSIKTELNKRGLNAGEMLKEFD